MLVEPIKPKCCNKYGICFASDNNYIKHLIIALKSLLLKTNDSFFYDIIILDNGIDSNNKDIVFSLNDGMDNCLIRFVPCRNIDTTSLNSRKGVSTTSYLRLLIPDLFNKYKKVLYLDCDLLINRDIAKLFEYDLGNNCIGAVRSSVYNAWCYENSPYGKKCKKYLLEKIQLSRIYDFVNAGVLLFNIPLLVKNGYSSTKLFKTAASYRWAGLDEDVINYVFKNKIQQINSKWNVMIAEEFNYNQFNIRLFPDEIKHDYILSHKNPYILHYAGMKQPIYNNRIEYQDLYWYVAKLTPIYKQLKKEEQAFKKTFKFKISSFIKKILPRNTKRWFIIKKTFKRKGGINF